MKKLSLMAALCIAGLGYTTIAAENGQILKEKGDFEIKVSEQDTTKRNPDTTRVPRTPDRRIPLPSDPTDPQSPTPVPTDPNRPNPTPNPTPVPTDPNRPNPTPSPTNPTPSSPEIPSSPSPTGPR